MGEKNSDSFHFTCLSSESVKSKIQVWCLVFCFHFGEKANIQQEAEIPFSRNGWGVFEN